MDEAWFVPDVCCDPSGIWRGLDRQGQEGAFCYAGIATGEFAKKNGQQVVAPANKLLMVFCTPNLEIAKWRFVGECPDRPEWPLDHATRYGERLWPRD